MEYFPPSNEPSIHPTVQPPTHMMIKNKAPFLFIRKYKQENFIIFYDIPSNGYEVIFNIFFIFLYFYSNIYSFYVQIYQEGWLLQREELRAGGTL